MITAIQNTEIFLIHQIRVPLNHAARMANVQAKGMLSFARVTRRFMVTDVRVVSKL